MKHIEAMLRDLDERIARLLPRQITAEGDSRFGGFWLPPAVIEAQTKVYASAEVMKNTVSRTMATRDVTAVRGNWARRAKSV